MGFLEVLTIVFVVLKLTGTIAWSWWWVFSPIIIAAAAYVLLLITAITAFVIAHINERKK